MLGSLGVVVGGSTVTGNFLPFIKDVTIKRSADAAYDTAEILLADPYGQIAFPKARAEIDLNIRGQWAFSGFVSDVGWKFDKGSGREMSISATSADMGSKLKEPVLRNKDDATFGDVAKEWGGKIGLDVQALGDLASIEREYWIMQSESFMSWGQRIAKDLGATFKVLGKRAFFSPRNDPTSASGKPLTPVFVSGGVNLLSADITPIIGRPQFKEVEAEWWDQKEAVIKKIKAATSNTDVEAVLRRLVKAPDEAQAQKKADAIAKESDRKAGSGTVTIIGDVPIEPEADVIVSGCRPGIDGNYRAEDVTLKLSKSAGFTTTISIVHPSGNAGKDAR